jgi:hypothetical protein
MGLKIALWGVVTLFSLGLYGVWMPMAGFEIFRPFVDRGEWFAVLALALGITSALLAQRLAPHTTRGVRRALMMGTACALVSSVAFAHYVFVFSYELPQAPDIAVGDSPPEIVAKDFLGDDFKLSDLQGKPAVVLFYRGHW